MSENENINLQNEENIMVVTFNITERKYGITLKNLTGMTQIDWGDGTINSELTHKYKNVGEYRCKIYNITKVGYMSFYSEPRLTNVIIPNNVTSIGSDAFENCNNLTSVTIGNGVTRIYENAFRGCSGLTSVMIPSSVNQIDECAFDECSSLTNITVNENNLRYCSIDGNLYTKDEKALIQYAIGKTATSFIIPDSVTSIGEKAFSCCVNLMSIVIPMGVVKIGLAAFSYTNFTRIIFKNPTPLSRDIVSSCGLLNTSIIHYVPVQAVDEYQTAWAGIIDSSRILPDPEDSEGNNLVTLGGLRIYHTILKTQHLDSMATQDWVAQYIRDNFATLMAEYLATEGNKPTAADINEVFNEEEEA